MKSSLYLGLDDCRKKFTDDYRNVAFENRTSLGVEAVLGGGVVAFAGAENR